MPVSPLSWNLKGEHTTFPLFSILVSIQLNSLWTDFLSNYDSPMSLWSSVYQESILEPGNWLFFWVVYISSIPMQSYMYTKMFLVWSKLLGSACSETQQVLVIFQIIHIGTQLLCSKFFFQSTERIVKHHIALVGIEPDICSADCLRTEAPPKLLSGGRPCPVTPVQSCRSAFRHVRLARVFFWSFRTSPLFICTHPIFLECSVLWSIRTAEIEINLFCRNY